jgi:hypothetical protein
LIVGEACFCFKLLDDVFHDLELSELMELIG